MTKEEVRARIAEIGIIPAVRLYSAEDALFAAETICVGGIPIVEVTSGGHQGSSITRAPVTLHGGMDRNDRRGYAAPRGSEYLTARKKAGRNESGSDLALFATSIFESP